MVIVHAIEALVVGLNVIALYHLNKWFIQQTKLSHKVSPDDYTVSNQLSYDIDFYHSEFWTLCFFTSLN